MNEIKSIISNINKEYLSLLKSIKVNAKFKTDSIVVLDEIKIFWKKHERECFFVIKYISETPFDTVFFTGASYIDYESKEHLPFACSAKNKIYDDRLPVLFEISSFQDKTKVPEVYMNQLKNMIEDHIKILEWSLEEIIFIPMSYILLDTKEISQMSGKLFFDFFTGIKSFEEFLRIKDRKSLLKYCNLEKLNLLSCDGHENFLDYIDSLTSDLLPADLENYAERFEFGLLSLLIQSVSICSLAMKTGFAPYLRYRTAMLNAMLILQSLYEQTKDIELSCPNMRQYIVGCHYYYSLFSEENKIAAEKLVENFDGPFFLDYLSEYLNSNPIDMDNFKNDMMYKPVEAYLSQYLSYE